MSASGKPSITQRVIDAAHDLFYAEGYEVTIDAIDQRLLDIWTGLAAQAGARQPEALARQLLLLFDGTKARGLTDNSGTAASDARAAARTLLDHSRQDCRTPPNSAGGQDVLSLPPA